MKFICLFLVLLHISSVTGQEVDSLVFSQDSVTTHSVRKATILSVCIPGAGQIYNHTAMPKGKKKAFWKVPLIYAGLGSLGYFIVNNHRTVLDLRTQYRNIVAGGVATGEWSIYGSDQTAILSLHDQYARRRDLSIIGFAAAYAIQVVDAAVEAHFVNFDVTEDLSLRISPTILNQQTAGVRLSLKFR
jgi:hypothetical protein